ncbi:hypothetical protein Tco_1222673 [Tanacetum coccineum]
MRLQAKQEAEHAELIHLDRLLAQRMQEEEEMTKQQKKRQVEVLESANSGKKKQAYDTNSTKNLHVKLSEALRIMDFCTIEEEVPVTEEPVKEPTAPKQEEIEQLIKKLGRQKSMARKRKLGQSTAKEDEEYKKEKEELSMFFIIAFDEHKEVYYEILDQRSLIIAWNYEYYGPKPLDDEVVVPEEINMNVVTRLNGRKRYFSVLSIVLSIFDRDDLSALYQLVIDKYQDEIPKGFDLIL